MQSQYLYLLSIDNWQTKSPSTLHGEVTQLILTPLRDNLRSIAGVQDHLRKNGVNELLSVAVGEVVYQVILAGIGEGTAGRFKSNGVDASTQGWRDIADQSKESILTGIRAIPNAPQDTPTLEFIFDLIKHVAVTKSYPWQTTLSEEPTLEEVTLHQRYELRVIAWKNLLAAMTSATYDESETPGEIADRLWIPPTFPSDEPQVIPQFDSGPQITTVE